MVPALAQQQVSYTIPAGNLGPALTNWARASGVKLLASSAALSGRSTRGISGSHAPQQALSVLLAGTGLTYNLDGSTVTILDPAQGTGAAGVVDGDAIQLDTIDVTGQGVAGGMTADTPYETAGSSAHISSEQLSRIPPTSPGDMFVGTPGVLNGGNRVGTSLNPNIRGLQGMGRVNTTVDGAINSTTSYRGYAGTRDETYVDPDMIGGIDITKGPSDGVGTGGIGGNINMRTLAAQDLVKDGESWGVRLKGSVGSNAKTALLKASPSDPELTRDIDRPGFFNGDNWSGSVAAATLRDNFEGVLAISKRQQGNYFAGESNVPDGFLFKADPNGTNPTGRKAVVLPGGEVYNTSEDTDSILAKAKFKWDDDQSLELGYMLYDSTAGEEDEALLNINGAFGQRNLSRTKVDTYTARYRYDPADNPLVNLRANLWHTDLEHQRDLGSSSDARNHGMATTGGDISNRSIFDTAFGTLTFNAGAEFRHEDAEAVEALNARNVLESRGPNGVRTLTSGFAKASFEPTDWLEVSAGARFDHYSAEGKRIAAVYPDRSESRLSPNVEAILKPLEGVQIFAQYKEGFRAPSLRELYWEFSTGFLEVNPDLKGEVSKNWEFGFNVLRDDVFTDGDKLRFKTSYFRNRYDDFILFALAPGGGTYTGPYEFTNIDRANYHGIELSGSYDTGRFFAEGAFTKYLTAEYCTPERGCRMPQFDEMIANITPPTYVPPEWSGSVTLGVRDEALTLGTRVHFSSTRYGSDWPPPASQSGLVGLNFTWPEFVVFDVFGSYKFTESTILNFSVENITDQYYYGPLATTGMPSPGRTARFSLTHTIGADGVWRRPDVPLSDDPEGTSENAAFRPDWSGFYVGGHYGFSSADVSGSVATLVGEAAPVTEAANYSDGSGIGGVQIGYNQQLDNRFVFGIEGDFSILSQTNGNVGTLATESAALIAGNYLESETEYKLDWMATLRGRVGYSFGRMMVYGTGGLGVVQQSGTRIQYISNTLSSSTTNPNPEPTSTAAYFSESNSDVSLGWTAGAGFEFALAKNWSIKGEYSYADFGAADFEFDQAREGVTRTYTTCRRCTPASTTIPGSFDTVDGRKASSEAEIHTLKLGLNYRF